MAQTSKEDLVLPWSTEKRLKFIEFRLFWEGRINRADLKNYFDISVPQASSDIQRYQSIAPGNMDYNKSGKYYFSTSSFKPIFIKPIAEDYFRYLSKISDDNKMTPLDSITEMDSVPLPGRRVDPYILRKILAAIRNKKSVEITYQSMSRPEPKNRWISPHAFGFDGFRWHIRAYCNIHHEYRDFLLGRVISVLNERDLSSDLPDDKKWNEYVTLKIGPNPGLKEGPRKVIEFDYGMENGQVSLTTRIALVYYLLKRLGIENGKEKSPSEQQIVLLNSDEVFKAIK